MLVKVNQNNAYKTEQCIITQVHAHMQVCTVFSRRTENCLLCLVLYKLRLIGAFVGALC